MNETAKEKPTITLGSGSAKTVTVKVDEEQQPSVVADTPTIKVADDKNLPALVEPQSLTTMKKIVDTIDISPEHLQQAQAVGNAHDFSDTNAALVFGAGPQRKYLENVTALLAGARVRDLQGAGSIILEIEKGIDMAGIEKLKNAISGGGGFFSKIFGGAANAVKAFVGKRMALIDLINGIKDRIEDEMQKIMTDNARLDQMIEDVQGNFYELGIWICAGEIGLENGSVEYNKLRNEAIESGDPLKITKVNIFREQVIALDTRLLRMKTAYVRAPITIQKVLTTQQAGRIETQNLMDSLLFDLPQFAETINTLLALYNIKGAQEDRKRREDMVARLNELEGNLLDEVAVTAKEGQIRGAAEAKMVEEAANKIMETCKKLKDLDQEHAKIRTESEDLLVRVQEDFKEGMKDITAS